MGVVEGNDQTNVYIFPKKPSINRYQGLKYASVYCMHSSTDQLIGHLVFIKIFQI